MKFKIIKFEEHQITYEIEADNKEEAMKKVDNGEGKEIARKSEIEFQMW